jgi:calcium/calmodulin-dependent protein kinase I
MVMEVCQGGELFDRIVEKEKYGESEARNCIRQIALALDYCHEKAIVHRDLKPENLLYGQVDNENSLKLADFGLAKLLDDNTKLHAACGTPGYVAPEILKQEHYSMPVDIWSLGVITYILFCGFPPFYDDNNSALFKAIKRGKYDYPSPFWDDVSPEAKDLIDNILVVDPNERFTAKDVLAHPFMTVAEKPEGLKTQLTHFKGCMKSYNARRKFRAGIMSLQAIHAMKAFSSPKVKKPNALSATLATALAAKKSEAEATTITEEEAVVEDKPAEAAATTETDKETTPEAPTTTENTPAPAAPVATEAAQ